MINKIINEFIITFKKNEKGEINEIHNLKNYSKYSNFEYINDIYQITNIIILLNPDKLFKIIFLKRRYKKCKNKPSNKN